MSGFRLLPDALLSRSDALSRLVHPTDPDTFKHHYWERQPLIVARDDPLFYENLLSLPDVDHILATSSVRNANLRVVKEGREMPIADLVTSWGSNATGLETLYAQYRDGWTIVLNSLHERWEPLARLCRSLADDFSAATQVNVYLTPRNAKGLTTHFDTHDVFVVQVAGSKHWRLFDSQVQLPLDHHRYRPPQDGPGEPSRELDLRAGDVIYIPRGWVHDAAANESASLHLTVGLVPITWALILHHAVESAIEEEPLLRKALPPGFALDDQLRTDAEQQFQEAFAILAKKVSTRASIGRAAREAMLRKQPMLNGHLLDMEAEPSLQLNTPVRQRPDTPWRMTNETEKVCLEFNAKVLRLPEYVESDLRFVTSTNSFTAAELPGELDDAGKLVLVRGLVREGFLTTVDGVRLHDMHQPR